MNERLLQFIWQHQHYNRSALMTEQGDSLEIINAGKWNANQGPDFIEARIRIGQTTWVGNIELHVQSSDWYKHNHDQDANYRNIILHVVWKNDEPEKSNLSRFIPILELQSRISKLVLKRYEELMDHVLFVPCEKHIPAINELLWQKWKERLLIERLQRKSVYIRRQLMQSNYHWEETLWWMIARNFGGKLNGESFEIVAKTIPLNILARHKNQLQQIEALLFGQAGLLDIDFSKIPSREGQGVGNYPGMLQKEYQFLCKKYKLQQPAVSMKFLRMRPSGFPTLRLAQLAVLIHQSSHLFSKMKELETVDEARQLLDVCANDYWHYHYRFDEAGSFKEKKVGADMVNNILINTISPMLYTFGFHQGEPAYQQKAIDWLEKMPAENNHLTRQWQSLGVSIHQAYDSQALIELKTRYCENKRCLDCAIGHEILKSL